MTGTGGTATEGLPRYSAKRSRRRLRRKERERRRLGDTGVGEKVRG